MLEYQVLRVSDNYIFIGISVYLLKPSIRCFVRYCMCCPHLLELIYECYYLHGKRHTEHYTMDNVSGTGCGNLTLT